MKDADIVVIGAGAAGLMAAIVAKQTAPNATVLILDSSKKIGVKILVSGGGRCNITHYKLLASDYHSDTFSKRQIEQMLHEFSSADIQNWFETKGVATKQEETGKIFPTNDRAKSVLDALLQTAKQSGCILEHPCKVEAIQPTDTGFSLQTSTENLRCHTVIMCTGGLALPASGSDGHGLNMSRKMGHQLIPTFPALAPLCMPPQHWLCKRKGINFHASWCVRTSQGKHIYTFKGEVVSTHFGLSGPAAMNVSRFFNENSDYKLCVNFLPTIGMQGDFETANNWLLQQAQLHPKRTAMSDLKQHGMPQRLAEGLCQDIDPALQDIPYAQQPKQLRKQLAHALTEYPLPIQGTRGYQYAETNRGGISAQDIKLKTLESKQHQNLFYAGEILDVDGRIGGFNFHWAWCTGKRAGRNAAKSLN